MKSILDLLIEIDVISILEEKIKINEKLNIQYFIYDLNIYISKCLSSGLIGKIKNYINK